MGQGKFDTFNSLGSAQFQKYCEGEKRSGNDVVY